MEKLDFKKFYKDLYAPGTSPSLIEVPAMKFIMVEGKGNPNEPEGEYGKAVELLYALSWTIKMDCKFSKEKSYYDYVVPPLEGLWWSKDATFDATQKEKFNWISMIRQPDFVDELLFNKALLKVADKKPQLDITKAALKTYTEGLCVQCMHLGPFDEEPATVAKIDAFLAQLGRKDGIDTLSSEGILRRHHEIYLNDPRKTKPSNTKAILRHPLQ